MIVFDIKCNSKEEMFSSKEKMHNALVGSPAYINSEIAICNCEEDETKFKLVVGNFNNRNVEFGVDFDSFEPIEIDKRGVYIPDPRKKKDREKAIALVESTERLNNIYLYTDDEYIKEEIKKVQEQQAVLWDSGKGE